jgi:hypothetical protein
MTCAAPCWPDGWAPAGPCGDRRGTTRGYKWHWARKATPGCWPACGPCQQAQRAYMAGRAAAEALIRGGTCR